MKIRLAALLLAACSVPAPPGPEVAVQTTDPVSDDVAGSEALGAVALPQVVFNVASDLRSTPAPHPVTSDVSRIRERLLGVVNDHARAPDNPWAIGHALLALGPDVILTNDEPAVAWLFSQYARPDDDGVTFPKRVGDVRVEPHTDLVLKALTEIGLAPDTAVVVDGTATSLAQLYRSSLRRAWVDGEDTAFSSWNDTPWALQGIATWAPPDLAWTASNHHQMTLDGFTHAVTVKLVAENEVISSSMTSGVPFEKRGQGIFSYTCGGAHLLQGAAYAVARGFGEESDHAAIVAQVPVLYHRFDRELQIVDETAESHPDYALVLMEQRLKFTGHFLESAHKLAAMGFDVPDPAQKATLERAMTELIKTVDILDKMGVFDRMDEVRATSEQTWLDVMGDSAHAVRGIDLATGVASIRL